MPRLVLEKVTKFFAAPDGKLVGAVQDLSLTVADKELLTLVGPSGCGKTTLLRLIAGLETVDRGEIRFDHQSVQTWSPQVRNVAMVFQSPALLPHLTGFENIAFGLKLRDVGREEIAQRVYATAEMLGVSDCLVCRPAELSGGERQRLSLGRALVRQPQILLLDEPFSQLDAPLRAQLRAEFMHLHNRLGMTVIYVTHDQAEALALGNQVAVMREGRLQQIGPPRQIHDAPVNRFVAGFLGSPSMNLFPGTIDQQDGYLSFISTPDTPTSTAPAFILRIKGERANAFGRHQGQRVLLGLRPEHLNATEADPADNSHPTINATLRTVEFSGAESILTLTVGEVIFHVRAGGNIKLIPGQNLSVGFDLRRARVFDAVTGDLLF